MEVAGIVLTGGQSRRMGRTKATLPFGAEVLLSRVLRLLAEVVHPRVVVAAPGQQLPGLSSDVMVVRDRAEGRGPLEGLYCGLTALEDRAAAAYVTGCDVPLLKPAFIRRLIHLLGDHDVVVPVDGDFHHPLAAVYRTRLAGTISGLIDRDRRRMISFYDSVSTRCVPVDELRDVDPELRSLMNMNRPEDYAEALRLAGLAEDR
jgi:molybdopterin-guanine dinucleotide biosynthesis protein A